MLAETISCITLTPDDKTLRFRRCRVVVWCCSHVFANLVCVKGPDRLGKYSWSPEADTPPFLLHTPPMLRLPFLRQNRLRLALFGSPLL